MNNDIEELAEKIALRNDTGKIGLENARSAAKLIDDVAQMVIQDIFGEVSDEHPSTNKKP